MSEVCTYSEPSPCCTQRLGALLQVFLMTGEDLLNPPSRGLPLKVLRE